MVNCGKIFSPQVLAHDWIGIICDTRPLVHIDCKQTTSRNAPCEENVVQIHTIKRTKPKPGGLRSSKAVYRSVRIAVCMSFRFYFSLVYPGPDIYSYTHESTVLDQSLTPSCKMRKEPCCESKTWSKNQGRRPPHSLFLPETTF